MGTTKVVTDETFETEVLKSDKLFHFENGQLVAPPYPGLGLAVDEDALMRYKVKR